MRATRFVHCPLTLDYGAVKIFLDDLDTSLVPVPGTAIGEAITKTAACISAMVVDIAAAKGNVARLCVCVDGEYGMGIFGEMMAGTPIGCTYIRGPRGKKNESKKVDMARPWMATSGSLTSPYDLGAWPLCAFALVRLAHEYLALLFRNRRPSLVFEVHAQVREAGMEPLPYASCTTDFVKYCLPLMYAPAKALPPPTPLAAAVMSTPVDEQDAIDAVNVVLSTLAAADVTPHSVLRFLNALTLMALSHQRRKDVPVQWMAALIPTDLPAVPTRQCINAIAQAQWTRAFILATQNMLLCDA